MQKVNKVAQGRACEPSRALQLALQIKMGLLQTQNPKWRLLLLQTGIDDVTKFGNFNLSKRID